MNTNVIEHHKRDQENYNTGFGKVENNKHPNAEGEQHTVKNRLKEDLQIMWHKVRLLQMSEREKLPKLKTNCKLIKLQEEIDGVIEELLEEDEMNITPIKKPDIRCSHNHDTKAERAQQKKKNRRDVKFWKIRMLKLISSWSNELSIIA